MAQWECNAFKEHMWQEHGRGLLETIDNAVKWTYSGLLAQLEALLQGEWLREQSWTIRSFCMTVTIDTKLWNCRHIRSIWGDCCCEGVESSFNQKVVSLIPALCSQHVGVSWARYLTASCFQWHGQRCVNVLYEWWLTWVKWQIALYEWRVNGWMWLKSG